MVLPEVVGTDPWSIDDIKLCTATMDLGSVNRLSPVRALNNCHRASLKIMLLAGHALRRRVSSAIALELVRRKASSVKPQAPSLTNKE